MGSSMPLPAKQLMPKSIGNAGEVPARTPTSIRNSSANPPEMADRLPVLYVNDESLLPPATTGPGGKRGELHLQDTASRVPASAQFTTSGA